jgi:hypothetical protein
MATSNPPPSIQTPSIRYRLAREAYLAVSDDIFETLSPIEAELEPEHLLAMIQDVVSHTRSIPR